MAGYQAITLKMTHARAHFDALLPMVDEFYESCRGRPIGSGVPARFGLLVGDCIQNLRSTLDYLVFELAAANGTTPNRKHMFPIAMSADQFARDAPQRLGGLNSVAIGLIDAIQPYHMSDPQSSPLYVLDELTNLNKHRRPILTLLSATEKDIPFHMPYMKAVVRRAVPGTSKIEDVQLNVWISFGEETAKGIEIISLLHTLAMSIGEDILPLFRRFLTN